jgi:2,5-dihydroxypyridine 5,6-dioxygenase
LFVLRERIEGRWIDCFAEVFGRCAVRSGDAVAIRSETQSRPVNVELAELALLRLGARPFHLVVPSPRLAAPAPVRSTGASDVLQRLGPVVSAAAQSTRGGRLMRRSLTHPRPTNGILVAITVTNWTFASSGKLAM